jgi:hypothetical protein
LRDRDLDHRQACRDGSGTAQRGVVTRRHYPPGQTYQPYLV